MLLKTGNAKYYLSFFITKTGAIYDKVKHKMENAKYRLSFFITKKSCL